MTAADLPSQLKPGSFAVPATVTLKCGCDGVQIDGGVRDMTMVSSPERGMDYGRVRDDAITGTRNDESDGRTVSLGG